MPGLGTIVNVLAIIAGGAAGLIFRNRVTERLQDTLIKGCGLITLFLGIGGTIQQMLRVTDGKLEATGTVMMLASIAVGGLIGELIDLDSKMESFGEWLKRKSGSVNDAQFVNGFVTTSLTVCIGAMAIVGSIEDVLLLNHTILFTKAVLDLIIVMIMTASLGKGCIFSAVPVGILQGTIAVLAGLLQPLFTAAVISNISYIGNILIFAVGVNLIWGKKIKVANFLPALIIAMAWAFI